MVHAASLCIIPAVAMRYGTEDMRMTVEYLLNLLRVVHAFILHGLRG